MNCIKTKLLPYLKARKKYVITCSVLFAFFCLLMYLIPYLGDDWSWGGYIGDERLGFWFKDYSGRYSGNLLVIALSRCKPLQVVVMAGAMVILCLLPLFLSSKKGLSLVSMSTALLFLMPHEIFVQSITWVSGFANYIPSIIISFFYLVIVRNLFKGQSPEYTTSQTLWLSVCVSLMGFVGAMFMENVTIFNFLFAIFVVIYTRKRYKKTCVVHISFLVSTILGAVAMFSNGAYTNAAQGDDFYRGTIFTKGFDLLFNNLGEICKHFFLDNFVLLAIISVLCFIILGKALSESKENKKRNFILALIAVNTFTLAIIFSNFIFKGWQILYKHKIASVILLALVAITYCLTVLLTVILYVKDMVQKTYMLILLSGVIILVGPFLLISPYHSRCLAPAYVMLSVFAVLLFAYVKDDFCLSKNTVKIVTVSFFAVAIAIFLFLVNIYFTIRKYDNLRVEYMEKQIESGEKVIISSNLPYTSYAWMSIPENQEWTNRFLDFHGFEKGYKVKFLSPDKFDEWRIEYDKNEVKK